jgi:hypothetical protein
VEPGKVKVYAALQAIDEKAWQLIGTTVRDSASVPENDHAWQEFIEVILKPNPKLSPSQRQVIASDFGMEKNEAKLPVRKALLYYFQKRLRIDVADALDNAQEAPVVVANRDIFEKALAETTGNL